jgi:hypothetical protein
VAVVVVVLIAVPLYLLKSPGGSQEPTASQATATPVKSQLIRTVVDAGITKTRVELSPVQRVRCSAGPDRQGNEGSLCDPLPQLEKDLASAIANNVECAPKTGKSGSVNFVMTLDFSRKQVHVFAGASGIWRGPQAKVTATCVRKALPEISWDTIPHRYRYYIIAILATYPPPEPSAGLPAFE